MPINRIFFKDANDFSAKQPMRPFPLEFAFIHESFINLDFVPRLWQFTNSWVKAIPLENSRIVLSGFSPIFPPVVDGGRRGGGRGEGGGESRIFGVIILPAVSFTSISFSLCNGSSTSGKLT